MAKAQAKSRRQSTQTTTISAMAQEGILCRGAQATVNVQGEVAVVEVAGLDRPAIRLHIGIALLAHAVMNASGESEVVA